MPETVTLTGTASDGAILTLDVGYTAAECGPSYGDDINEDGGNSSLWSLFNQDPPAPAPTLSNGVITFNAYGEAVREASDTVTANTVYSVQGPTPSGTGQVNLSIGNSPSFVIIGGEAIDGTVTTGGNVVSYLNFAGQAADDLAIDVANLVIRPVL